MMQYAATPTLYPTQHVTATTAIYRRSRIGERARPIMREIAEETSALQKSGAAEK